MQSFHQIQLAKTLSCNTAVRSTYIHYIRETFYDPANRNDFRAMPLISKFKILQTTQFIYKVKMLVGLIAYNVYIHVSVSVSVSVNVSDNATDKREEYEVSRAKYRYMMIIKCSN